MKGSVFITGFALSAALIVAIGAQNTFVLRQGLRREHVPAIVLFCATADLVLISAGVAGVGSIIEGAPQLIRALTLGSIVFLLWYACRSLCNALRPRALRAGAGAEAAPLGNVLMQATGFTFLNPHVYLDTVLFLGSVGARQPPELRLWFIGGAAVASVAWFSSLGFGARLLTPLFEHPRAWQVLDVSIGLMMLLLAAALAAQPTQG